MCFDEEIRRYIIWLLKEISFPVNVISLINNSICEINQDSIVSTKILNWSNDLLCGNIEYIYNEIKVNPKKNGLIALISVLKASYNTYCQYKYKGISNKIFIDTMYDISIWTNNFFEDNKFLGLLEVNWLSLHLRMKVFRLGRLQFELSKFNEMKNLKQISLLPKDLRNNDKALEIHIPQGGKLLIEDCMESLKEAKKFFKNFFPDFNFSCYVCYSWLLSPILNEVLQENSNIIKFQKLFNIVYLDMESEQYLERIFGRNYKEMTDFPRQTVLQKKTIQFIAKNKKIGAGFGVIINDES